MSPSKQGLSVQLKWHERLTVRGGMRKDQRQNLERMCKLRRRDTGDGCDSLSSQRKTSEQVKFRGTDQRWIQQVWQLLAVSDSKDSGGRNGELRIKNTLPSLVLNC